MSWIVIKMPDDSPEMADPFAFVYKTFADATLAITEDVVEDHETHDEDITTNEAAQRLKWIAPTRARCAATETSYTLHEVTIR